jgi:hypothetical protein
MAYVTSQEIVTSIMFGNLTDHQINDVIEAIKYARKKLAASNYSKFRLGDTVKFNTWKRGWIVGKIVKKSQVKSKVDVGGVIWRVPNNMLMAA